MITDRWVSANSCFHREEVGSSWSGGVVLEAGLPSAGKAHLEEKQSIMGGCRAAAWALVRERENASMWDNKNMKEETIRVKAFSFATSGYFQLTRKFLTLI